MWRDASATVMAKRRLRDKTHDTGSKLRTLLTQLSAASKRCFFFTHKHAYTFIYKYIDICYVYVYIYTRVNRCI